MIMIIVIMMMMEHSEGLFDLVEMGLDVDQRWGLIMTLRWGLILTRDGAL